MKRDSTEYDEVRTLLRLKQYEAPPPGYFASFPDQVLNRIESEARARGWFDRLFGRMDFRPLLSFAYGVAVTGLFICGLGFSQTLVETLEVDSYGMEPANLSMSSMDLEGRSSSLDEPGSLFKAAVNVPPHAMNDLIRESSVSPMLGFHNLEPYLSFPRLEPSAFSVRGASFSF